MSISHGYIERLIDGAGSARTMVEVPVTASSFVVCAHNAVRLSKRANVAVEL